MTFNETKSLLEQIKRQRYYAQKQQEELGELITTYQCLTASFGRVGSSNKISNPVLNTVIKIEKAQESYVKEWEAVIKKIEDIKLVLLNLPTEERHILDDYYIRGKSVNYIARQFNYDRRTIYRRIDRGIDLLSKVGTNVTNKGL